MPKTSHDFEEFNALLLATIRDGVNTMRSLTVALASESRQFGTKDSRDDFRVIERRLQVLRKKGLIVSKRDGGLPRWIVL